MYMDICIFLILSSSTFLYLIYIQKKKPVEYLKRISLILSQFFSMLQEPNLRFMQCDICYFILCEEY